MELRPTSSQCWEGLHRNSQKAQLPPICWVQHCFVLFSLSFPAASEGSPLSDGFIKEQWGFQAPIQGSAKSWSLPGTCSNTSTTANRGVCGCSTSPVGYQQGLLSGNPGATFPSLLPREHRVALQSWGCLQVLFLALSYAGHGPASLGEHCSPGSLAQQSSDEGTALRASSVVQLPTNAQLSNRSSALWMQELGLVPRRTWPRLCCGL